MNEDIENKFHALQEYETSVSVDDWEVISSRLQQRKRRKLIVAWFSVGAIAASVALFFLLHYPSPAEELLPPVVAAATVTNNTPALPDTQVQTSIAEPVVKLQKAAKPHIAKYSQTQTINIDTIQTENIVQIAAIDPIETTAESTIAVAEAMLPAIDSLFTFPMFDEPLPYKNKNAQTWAIAFLAGQTVGFNTSFDDNEKYLFLDRNLANEYPEVNYRYLLNDAIDTRHRLPLSAGITFRFYFIPRRAVESGLVYTYLASDYTFSNQAKIKQQLHYLGIPVNLVWQFIESKGFYFYVSGGCMLEKGLSANYNYIGFPNENTRSESIAGLQWSLNVQLGVGYNVYKQFGLYFEPGLRWFLPNKSQPVSIRTERPLNFGLSAGLRLNF